MHVGVCKVTLRLPENQDLKGKRRLISSISSRIRNRFNVAVNEVGDNESWQLATLGIGCVSNSARHADEVIDRVLSYIESSREDLELIGCDRETMAGF